MARPRADDPEHADELRIDLDPQPGVGFDEARVAAHERAARCSTSSASTGCPKTTGNRGIHVYVRLAAAVGRRSRCARAAVAVARELARRRPDVITDAWWKEERGERDLRRLQPERAAQDGVRRVVGAGAARRAGVDAVRAGTSSTTIDPDALTIATVPGARRGARRPVGRRSPTDPQSLEPLLEMYERDLANGLAGRAVAARLPEDAGRAAAGRAQPGQEAGRREEADARQEEGAGEEAAGS